MINGESSCFIKLQACQCLSKDKATLGCRGSKHVSFIKFFKF